MSKAMGKYMQYVSSIMDIVLFFTSQAQEQSVPVAVKLHNPGDYIIYIVIVTPSCIGRVHT